MRKQKTMSLYFKNCITHSQTSHSLSLYSRALKKENCYIVMAHMDSFSKEK